MDPFRILGVPADADERTLARARRRLARRWHPDVAGAEGERRMREINRAYEEAVRLVRMRRRPASTGLRLRLVTVPCDVEAADAAWQRERRVRARTEDGRLLELRFRVPRHAVSGTVVPLAPAPDMRVRVVLRLLLPDGWEADDRDLLHRPRIPWQRFVLGNRSWTVDSPTGERFAVRLPDTVAGGRPLRLPGRGLWHPSGRRGDLLLFPTVDFTSRPDLVAVLAAAADPEETR